RVASPPPGLLLFAEHFLRLFPRIPVAINRLVEVASSGLLGSLRQPILRLGDLIRSAMLTNGILHRGLRDGPVGTEERSDDIRSARHARLHVRQAVDGLLPLGKYLLPLLREVQIIHEELGSEA